MESYSSHFKFDKFQSKRYETKDEVKEDLEGNIFNPNSVEQITLSGNSYGKEACELLGAMFESDTPKLVTINFNDMFVGRKLPELPPSLEILIRSLMKKKIEHLNLSDNAFGPAGIKSFDFFLQTMDSLKSLKVTNCGLGPEGGEMIANALKENKSMKLEVFAAGRDRLENKGSAALGAVFKEMKSLQVIDIPQNGIKKDGMIGMLDAFIANAETLREVYINDNWIKQEAVDKLVEFILMSKSLTRLNISDSDMGNEAIFKVIRALKGSVKAKETLTEFYCNYNEVDSNYFAKECLDILLKDLPGLTYVEFKGNLFSNKMKAEYATLFEEKNKRIIFKDANEEGDDEEDMEEEEEDEEQEQKEKNITKSKKIEEDIVILMGKLNLGE